MTGSKNCGEFMAHTDRCETADTDVSECECSCGGTKHGIRSGEESGNGSNSNGQSRQGGFHDSKQDVSSVSDVDYPSPIESVGEVRRKPDTKVSPQQWRGYLPITFEDGSEVEIPVQDVDVIDLPGEIEHAQAVYLFEGMIVADFGVYDGTDFELTYNPRIDEWEIHWADSEETLPYTEVVPKRNILWKN